MGMSMALAGTTIVLLSYMASQYKHSTDQNNVTAANLEFKPKEEKFKAIKRRARWQKLTREVKILKHQQMQTPNDRIIRELLKRKTHEIEVLDEAINEYESDMQE